jgi:hypothetical protein
MVYVYSTLLPVQVIVGKGGPWLLPWLCQHYGLNDASRFASRPDYSHALNAVLTVYKYTRLSSICERSLSIAVHRYPPHLQGLHCWGSTGHRWVVDSVLEMLECGCVSHLPPQPSDAKTLLVARADIALGREGGLRTFLPLTGVTTLEDFSNVSSAAAPDFYMDCLATLTGIHTK